MVYRPDISERLCFVLMPFQDFHFQYFKGIIAPVAESLGLQAQKADDIYGTAPIIQDIWHAIWTAKVVIADVTGRNPNVNYELGLCHALGVPTVLITQNLDDVPFDYRHRRCIVYNTKRVDWQDQLRKDITLTLKAVLEGKDSPEDLAWPYNTTDVQYARRSALFVPVDEAREPILRGISLGQEALAKALGPHGTSVSVSSAFGDGTTDRSGALILAALEASNPLVQRGLDQLRSVSREVSSELGDGTKGAALLLAEMVSAGFAALQEGLVLRDLIHDMDVATETAVRYIEEQSQPASQRDVLAVAQTAAVGDKLIGKLVNEAISKTGPDGVVYTEDSPGLDSTLEVREGMYFDRGFISARFITDEPKQLAVLQKPYVFLFDGKLTSMKSLLPLLEQVAKAKSSLLVVADDVEGEALETLIANHLRGTLPSVAVRSPGGQMRRALLEDIAVATGGMVVPASNYALENAFLGQLGRADRVEVSKHTTWLIGGRGKSELVESRAAGIRQQIAVSNVDYELEKLRERLAKLVGRISAIRVGGASVVDRSDRRYRVQSSLHSAQASLAGGVSPGGGTILWRARTVVLQTAQTRGSQIVSDALGIPLRTQLNNSRVDLNEILSALGRSTDEFVGFNSETRRIGNLREEGVLDATKVVVRGLQIAFAHARTVLQTGAWDISEAPRPMDLRHVKPGEP